MPDALRLRQGLLVQEKLGTYGQWVPRHLDTRCQMLNRSCWRLDSKRMKSRMRIMLTVFWKHRQTN